MHHGGQTIAVVKCTCVKCTDLWSWRSTRMCEWQEVPRPRSTVRQGKPCPVPHCHAQQTSHHTPLSDTTNLAPCPTVRHITPCPVPHCQTANLAPRLTVSKPCPVSHAPLSDTANLASRLTVSKPCPVPHCQTQQNSPTPHCQKQQNSHQAQLSDTANLALCPITVRQQTSPRAPLSDTANLAPRPTFRHSKSCLCLCFYTHNICTVPLQQFTVVVSL